MVRNGRTGVIVLLAMLLVLLLVVHSQTVRRHRREKALLNGVVETLRDIAKGRVQRSALHRYADELEG